MSSMEEVKRVCNGWNLLVIALLCPSLFLFSMTDRQAKEYRLENDLSAFDRSWNVSVKRNVSAPDPSCFSRTQVDVFRKSSPIPPLLSRAFAKYERMHARCYHGRGWSRSISDPDPEDTCKYIVYLQDGKFGLGNHILSLASAFVYALLTNRMLLIDSRRHLPSLFCEPFRNSSWLLPDDFPYQHLLQAPFLDKEFDHKVKYVNAVHLMLFAEYGQKRFFCPKTQALLENVKWIGWSCNQYYIPRFFMIPKFWRPLVKLFPDVSMTFTHLSRYLFLPNNQVWQKIARFQRSYLSTPGKKLGLQIRMRGDRATFDFPTLERVKECVVENGFLPNVSSEPGDINGLKHLLAGEILRGAEEELRRQREC